MKLTSNMFWDFHRKTEETPPHPHPHPTPSPTEECRNRHFGIRQVNRGIMEDHSLSNNNTHHDGPEEHPGFHCQIATGFLSCH